MEQHWAGYLKALGGTPIPATSMPAVAPYDTSSNETGVSGFLDLKVKNPKVQANYDAMSSTWLGVEPSTTAVAKGVFKPYSMPVDKNLSKK